MKRVISAAALLALVGLTAATVAGGARHASPTKLTVWVGWSAGKELITFKKVAAEYDKAHPDVTLDVVGGIVDQKIVAAIRAGQAPDVVSSFNSYDVGIYCGTKAWLDLKPYMDKSHISTSIFPKATLYYTQYAGTRCALPLLADTYGLYYNKALFAKAGIKSPPKTISELTADAKKLTQRNKDGSLKVGRGVRWDVHRLEGQREPLQAGCMAEDAEVAEEPHRLVRLQQPREVPGGPR
jgi:multiple sugar transport system substrate-binding protein